MCIVACLLVMRRMSGYMIERSSNLVDRLAVSTGLAHQIAGTAQQAHGLAAHDLDAMLGGERRRYHDKIGAAIGSGPKEASRRSKKGGLDCDYCDDESKDARRTKFSKSAERGARSAERGAK